MTMGSTPAGPATAVMHRRRAVAFRRTPLWWRDAVAAVCWASVLVVIALWLSGGGLSDLSGSTGQTLTSLGRITGLVSADLLLVQVALMARVPWIERSYGQDVLAKRHRLVGLWSFDLLLVHVVLITVGYALTDHLDVPHETWTLLTSYAGILLAFVGTATLAVVAATSVRAARRRLRYESWHLLHLYAYVGVAATVPHELWTGADFTRSRAATLYWWSAYVAVAVAVLLFRVGLPLWRSSRHRLVVTHVVRESRDVVTVHLRGRHLDRFPVRAGQFLVWRFLSGPGWTRGHPFSLSASPTRDHVQISVKDLGAGSRRLAGLRPGTRAFIEGPYGRLTAERQQSDVVTLLACGIGITPIRALLDELHFAPGAATLVYRVRSSHDLVFRAELEQLAQQRGVDLHLLVGPRRRGGHSWLPEGTGWPNDATALLDLAPDVRRSDVFVCGPTAWMGAVSAAARRLGVPSARIHIESFAW